jgi:hypothetical protein
MNEEKKDSFFFEGFCIIMPTKRKSGRHPNTTQRRGKKKGDGS